MHPVFSSFISFVSFSHKSLAVYGEISFGKICSVLSENNDALSTAASVLIQNLLLSLTGLEDKRKTIKKKINVPFEFSKS